MVLPSKIVALSQTLEELSWKLPFAVTNPMAELEEAVRELTSNKASTFWMRRGFIKILTAVSSDWRFNLSKIFSDFRHLDFSRLRKN